MLKILIWSLQQKTQTCLDELSHVAAWEAANNMQLNKAKTKELFSDCVASSRRKRTFHRRSQTLSEWLASQYSMSSSTTNWRQLTACTSLLYAPCVLRCHGVRDQSLKDVFQAIEGLLAKITYCLPAWSGLCTAADRTHFWKGAWSLGTIAPTNHRRYHPLPTMQRTLSSKMYSETLNTYCSPTWKSDRSYATILEIDPESTSLCSRKLWTLMTRDFLVRNLYKNSY